MFLYTFVSAENKGARVRAAGAGTNTEESRITPELQKFSGHALISRDCPTRNSAGRPSIRRTDSQSDYSEDPLKRETRERAWGPAADDVFEEDSGTLRRPRNVSIMKRQRYTSNRALRQLSAWFSCFANISDHSCPEKLPHDRNFTARNIRRRHRKGLLANPIR